MKLFTHVLLALLVVVATSCGESQPRFDGSSETAFEESKAKLLEPLTEVQRDRISAAISLISMSALHEKRDPDEFIREQFDGQTAQQVLAAFEHTMDSFKSRAR